MIHRAFRFKPEPTEEQATTFEENLATAEVEAGLHALPL